MLFRSCLLSTLVLNRGPGGLGLVPLLDTTCILRVESVPSPEVPIAADKLLRTSSPAFAARPVAKLGAALSTVFPGTTPAFMARCEARPAIRISGTRFRTRSAATISPFRDSARVRLLWQYTSWCKCGCSVPGPLGM